MIYTCIQCVAGTYNFVTGPNLSSDRGSRPNHSAGARRKLRVFSSRQSYAGSIVSTRRAAQDLPRTVRMLMERGS